MKIRDFICIAISLLYFSTCIHAQTGRVEGFVYSSEEREPVLFATLMVDSLGQGTTSDLDGNFILDLSPGTYQLNISSIGYKDKTLGKIVVKEGETVFLEIELEESIEILQEVVVLVSPLSRKEKSPLSLRTLRSNEIQYGAGSSGDISFLIQNLPGISSPPGLSNALNIRGGSSFENRFFVDDVEIPLLNHYAKQGTSGGFRSLLNIDMIDRVNVFTSAFPIEKGNGLSGVFDFYLKEGNKEKWSGSFLASSVDLSLLMNGPIGNKATFSGALRRSYTRPVAELLGQPMIGKYNDWNYKAKWNINKNHQITILGIGGDDYGNANDDPEETPINLFLRDVIRPVTQNNWVNAIKYTNFRERHFTNIILSQFTVNEGVKRYFLQDDSNPSNLIENYDSNESEWRLTVKNTQRFNDLKILTGGELGRFANKVDAFYNITGHGETFPVQYQSGINFYKWAAYIQFSQRLLNRFLLLSVGARVDANDFSAGMNNPLEQFAPRLSVAYALNQQTTINFNTGRYYQLPAGYILSFKDNSGTIANQSSAVSYFSATHLAGGLEWEQFSTDVKINIEAFYKNYDNYPVSVIDQVTILDKEVNLFRSVSEPVVSKGTGKAYGFELLIEKKSMKGFYGKLAYTLAWSQFKDSAGQYRSSLYDTRHVLNLNLGRHLENDWHLGFNFSWSSPQPYTPFDFERSSLIASWSGAQAFNIPDYNRLNTERTDPIVEFNIRIDKLIHFDNWNLNLFLDVLNVFDYRPAQRPLVALVKDAGGMPQIDPKNPLAYQTFWLDHKVSTLFPSLGLKVSF